MFSSFLLGGLSFREICLLFVTAHVQVSYHRSATPSRVLAEFNPVYRSMLRSFLGQNFHRKPHLQPRVLVAFDREGTKSAATRPDSLDAFPHIHAILSVPPNVQSRFSEVEIEALLQKLIPATGFFEEPFVQHIDRNTSNLRNLIAYSMKDARLLEATPGYEDYAFDWWPKS